MRLVSIALLMDKFKIVGSVARKVMRYFAAEGKLIPLDYQHQQCPLYTGAEKKDRKVEGEGDEKKKGKK